MSRTALDGYVLGDVEKDFLLNHIRWLAKVYFVEVLGFCIMGNHFHLLVRMDPGREKSLAEIQKRFEIYYGEDDKRELTKELIPTLKEKWGSLSEFVKEIKQGFSRFYNRRHRRKGFFWSERFKSVIVDNGETLINCLAYIDLNPIRAGIAKKPEEYRWCSLGYHAQTNNRDRFLSTDFGLMEFALEGQKERLAHYRRFVYEKGGLIAGMEDRWKALILLVWRDFGIGRGILPTAGSSVRRSLYRECTRTSRDILPQGMRSGRKLFRGWMASIPSSAFLKTLHKESTAQLRINIFDCGPIDKQTNIEYT